LGWKEFAVNFALPDLVGQGCPVKRQILWVLDDLANSKASQSSKEQAKGWIAKESSMKTNKERAEHHPVTLINVGESLFCNLSKPQDDKEIFVRRTRHKGAQCYLPVAPREGAPSNKNKVRRERQVG